MRIIIMRAVMGLGTLVLAMAVDSGTAAKAGPWCVWYDSWTYNCGFHTYEQCYATAFGTGYCLRNAAEGYQRSEPESFDEPRHRHHRHHHHEHS